MAQTPSPSPGPNEKRRAANKANSQHSSGPTTEPGKQISSQNSFKFGFFSPKALLPGESAEEFDAFGQNLLNQLCPRNPLEVHLVEQYIALAWRAKRLPEIEAGVFTRYGISVQGNQCGAAFAMVASVQQDNILGQLARYEATLRKNMFKYFDLLRALRKDGWGKATAPVLDAQVADVTCEQSVQPVTAANTSGSPNGVSPVAASGLEPSHGT
jgi:hypothetical protein